MEITQRELNDIIILQIEGDLETNTAPDAENFIAGLLEQKKMKILINCEKLDYISSAGLRVLLGTAKQLEAYNGEMRVCSLNETVQEIFDISGFGTILSVFATENEAVSGF